LGQYVANALSSSYEVEVSDIDTVDVTDLKSVLDGLRASSPDIVCHLAGLTGAPASTQNPHKFFSTNSVGTLNVLEACRIAQITKLVFMSTLTVHGDSEGGPVNEQSPYKPLHPYAGSKAAAEVLVETYARSFGIKSAILRTTLVSGEGQKDSSAIAEFVRSALNERTLEMYGDGRHQREWLHPIDVAQAVKAAADFLVQTPGVCCETFIITSPRPTSMRDLAQHVISTVGKGQIEFRPATRQAFSLCSETGKAKAMLHWVPGIGVEEIIRRIADHSLSKEEDC